MFSTTVKSIVVATALALGGTALAQDKLLNVSYDVAREFYKDYNAAFIAHYERLSRHALASLPAPADIVVELDESRTASANRFHLS